MSKQRSEITKDILSILGAVGLITVMVVAPNFLRVFAKSNVDRKRKYYPSDYQRSLNALTKSGHITIRRKVDRNLIELTSKGQEYLKLLTLGQVKIKVPKKWDRKWHVVIFDIPEGFKTARTEFVNRLKNLGFSMIQKSVWVYPYPCREELFLITDAYLITKYVSFILANEVDQEMELRRIYNLV